MGTHCHIGMYVVYKVFSHLNQGGSIFLNIMQLEAFAGFDFELFPCVHGLETSPYLLAQIHS